MREDPCVREALFWEGLDGGAARCGLCPHRCLVKEGHRGICGVRENRGGQLMTLVYGRLVAERPDPIEKKPLYHFLPGTLSHSIATAGCNMRCDNCQNYSISQSPKGKGPLHGEWTPPADVVERALSGGSRSVSYTYTEPTVYIEYALDVMALAREKGLSNVFVTNGYTSPEALEKISAHLDAANVDLKSISDEFYKSNCGARLAPVVETISYLRKRDVWVEATTLVIPGMNDSEEELRAIARTLISIDADIPWHVTGFFPTFRLTDRPATPAATLMKAREWGLSEGLSFVYAGNRPGRGGEDTFCPGCGVVAISRLGFEVTSMNVAPDGKCKACGVRIPGRFSRSKGG